MRGSAPRHGLVTLVRIQQFQDLFLQPHLANTFHNKMHSSTNTFHNKLHSNIFERRPRSVRIPAHISGSSDM